MPLVIAEKPSVARDIAKVLGANKKNNGYLEGNGWQVSWCVGHLIRLSDPEEYDPAYQKWSLESLPILPDSFQTSVIKQTQDQFGILQHLISCNDEIICATDAGREGQLIFEYVMAKCENIQSKKIKRLWISSMTDTAIQEGFANLKDNAQYYNLYQSAKCRSEADWLVGINFSRLFSLRYNGHLSVGRVQTPTLALIVNRKLAIDQFVPETYYQIEGHFGTISATYTDATRPKLTDEAYAEQLAQKFKGQQGTITKLITTHKQEDRPLLYDLTELQRDANKRFGYTAQQTLTYAQSLYETHKVLTYPRTDSRYLSQDMKTIIPTLLKKIPLGFPQCASIVEKLQKEKLPLDKRIFDDKKITDHHAIIPTANIDKIGKLRLNKGENDILFLVICRFLTILSPKKLYDETKLEITLQDGSLFKSSGKLITQEGWTMIEKTLLGKNISNENEDEKEQVFPNIQLNQILVLDECKLIEKNTSPPKLYTEATLLSAMENAGRELENKELKDAMKDKGLGTPATRAAIIERLIQVGYVTRQKKNLLPTRQGIAFIKLAPKDIVQAELTANWEWRLENIRSGKEDPQNFMNDIRQYVADITKRELAQTPSGFFTKDGELRHIVGKCPFCGKEVVENSKGYYCRGYKDASPCTFTLWKENKYFSTRGIKEITPSMARQLLNKGYIRINNLYSQKGSRYNGIFYLETTQGQVKFRMEFANDTK